MSWKFTATPIAPDPEGDAVALGDETGGDFIIDPLPLPSERRAVQGPVNVAFGQVAFTRGRGNRRTSFSWTVLRIHDSYEDACAFKWAHASEVPINCELQVEDESGITKFSRAVIMEVAVVAQLGLSTTTRYTVEGAVWAGREVEQV